MAFPSGIYRTYFMVLWMVFVGIGVMGRIWCSLYISGFKNAKLVTDGPYSLCRNPLYLFSYLGGVGIMLITETFIFPIVFTLYFLCYYHFVIRQEEAFLSEKYGTAYSDYIKTIPRFYQVSKILKSLSSIRFHRSISVFFDAGGVVYLGCGLSPTFDELRLHGVLPSLFSWF